MTSLLLIASLACSTGSPEAPASPAPAAAPATTEASAPQARPGEVDVAGLQAAMASGPITLVDVRSEAEYAEGHAPGAVLIPLDQLEARLGELEDKKAEPVYLICASGGRSSRAADSLVKAGFAQPINVAGGTRAWIAAGYPTE